MRLFPATGSLRRRLVAQLLIVAAVLAVILYATVRSIAYVSAEAAQDGVLGAATVAIAEQLRGGEDGIDIDLPYSTFSMLGAIGEDRLFYRIDIGNQTVTGYGDLPVPPRLPETLEPVFYTTAYRDTEVRIAAVSRTLLTANAQQPVIVMVGQTRTGQAAIAARMANRAAMLGLGFFALAVPLALLAAGSMLRPVNRLAEAVGRRGPNDLRAVRNPAPRELDPLILSLNGFIARLRSALGRTETFITEAAHHIRTPLSTVRSEAEIALRHVDASQSGGEEVRKRLRNMIRAVEESSRSAGQLLDHASVLYRADQPDDTDLDLARTIEQVIAALQPAADLKDLTLERHGLKTGITTRADRLLLESALRNLLDNAIKYSPSESTVMISLHATSTSARIEIADRGRGLSGATRADLVERFKRGTNVADVVGSGLGLTIVAKAADALGGTFEITSLPQGGTCALLDLPLR